MFTRTASQPPGRRRPLTIFLVFGFVVFLILTAAGTIWTDYLWFDSVGYGGVWAKNWSWMIMLGLSGVLFAFAVFWLTLYLADRFAPRWPPFDVGDDEDIMEKLRDWVSPRAERVRILVALGLALLLGLAVSTWRPMVFLYLNREAFGRTDPIHGVDLSFYVFQLPLASSLIDWLFSLMVMATILVVVSHYLSGALLFDGRRLLAARAAKIQLSVMLALVALVRAASYRLDRYELLLSNSADSSFFGPGYTDIHARLPVLNLLTLIAVVAALLIVINIWRRGWTMVGVSVAAWLLVSIGAGAIYPALIQRFEVLPNQRDLELPYIANNLEATRAAYLLDQIDVRPFAASDDLTIEDIERNRLTIDNLRIWSPSVLLRTFQNFQELLPYYYIGHVDTDRYMDEGTPRQVMVGVRELDEADLPRDDWQNTRLFYTHGYGAVVNQANVVQSDGQPMFLLKDLPPVALTPVLELSEPRVYFGETYQPDRPVIVRTGARPQEIDGGSEYNEYQGDAGVVLDSIWKRIAFAFRYRDINLLISGEIRPDSKVLVERNVRQIVDNLAPFLVSDSDPYPVISNGEILWVLDMYTTSSNFPYAEPVTRDTRDRLSITSSLPLGTNYIRNSVKAVISANNGDVTFYVADPSDPVIRTWNRTYPNMFVSLEALPAGLEDHLRYPQDQFRVQSQLYLEYHVDRPEDLFTGNDAWTFPEDPSTPGQRVGAAQIRADSTGADARNQVLPYYLMTDLPGENELSYLLLQPFNPLGRRNMASFLVADSTPGRYGRLIDFRMPSGVLVDGVGQVGLRIEQDAEIAQQLTLWSGSGAKPIKGDLLVVPIEDSVIYFQPIYLEEAGGAFPEFRRVVVVYGERVEWADSLDAALELVFGTTTTPPVDPPPGGSDDVSELVAQAVEAFDNANAALTRGDLAGYERWMRTAESLIREIEEILSDLGEARIPDLGWVLGRSMS